MFHGISENILIDSVTLNHNCLFLICQGTNRTLKSIFTWSIYFVEPLCKGIISNIWPCAVSEMLVILMMTQTLTYHIFMHTIISIIFAIKKWCWSRPTLKRTIILPPTTTTTAIINHSVFFEKRSEEIAWNAHFAEIKTFDCAVIIVWK